MKDLERIGYGGFSKEYAEQRLKIALDSNDLAKWKPGRGYIPLEWAENAEDKILEGQSNAAAALIVRAAFRFKKLIRHIPFLNYAAQSIKNKLLSESYARQANGKDVSHLMSISSDEFINEAYRALLERAPDPKGIAIFNSHMSKGASREAVIYIIASSDEFHNSFPIKNLALYKKRYIRFKINKAIRKLPLVGNLIRNSEGT